MQRFYTNFTKNTFKILTILFCYLGDFSVLLYIYYKFNNFEIFKKIMKMHPTLNMDQLGQDMVKPLFDLTMKSLLLLIFLAVIAHSVVYILFWYEKKAAIRYIKILSLLGAPTCPFLLFEAINTSSWALWFIPQMALYIFIFLGIFYFKELSKK